MITREELLKDKNKLFDKVYGSISGLAIGDSFGDASRKPENKSNYGITTDFNKGASWSTDDTEFALLTLKTMIDCKGKLKSEDVVNAWLQNVATQDEFKRGGASEIEAAINLKKGLRPPLSGKYNAFHMSDGSAMRIAPIGVFAAGNPDLAFELAGIDASVSHFRDGVWGAQAVAVVVSLAMIDYPINEAINKALSYIPKESWFYNACMKSFDIIEKYNYDLFDSWMPIHDELWTSSWATTAEAISQTFCSLKLEHSSFKKGVIIAGNFGRDADTIGAVAGAILGAKYGASSIPEGWSDKTRFPTGTCLLFTKGLDIKAMSKSLVDIIINQK